MDRNFLIKYCKNIDTKWIILHSKPKSSNYVNSHLIFTDHWKVLLVESANWTYMDFYTKETQLYPLPVLFSCFTQTVKFPNSKTVYSFASCQPRGLKRLFWFSSFLLLSWYLIRGTCLVIKLGMFCFCLPYHCTH